MSNTAIVKVFFEGSTTQLKKVNDLIITKGPFNKTIIDFDYIKPMVPGIKDKQMYELFNCDFYKLNSDEYSPEETKQYHDNVEQLVKSQGWIGMRDMYVNQPSWNAETSYKDGRLKVEASFHWYVPTLFFAKIAKDFGLTMKALEFVEGNNTFLSYTNETGVCIDIKNSHESIINNEIFRDYSIELGLHKPSDLVAVCIVTGNTNLAKELIKKNSVTSEEMEFSFSSLNVHAKEPFDFYQSSAFVGLDFDKILTMTEVDLNIIFNKIQTEITPILPSKKLK